MSNSEEQDYIVVDQSDLSADSKSAQEISELARWLHPTDYLGESSDFKKHLNSHVPGTGEWIRDTSQYRDWHDSATNGSLWLKAVAGAGKSVLAARLVSHLQETESNTPVLFFFFRQIILSNHDPHSLVRDWLTQLLNYSPHLQIKVDGFRKERRIAKDIAFNELWQLLVDAFRSLDKVYCVVDALDELDSEHTPTFLQSVVALGEMRPSAIKLLMTSRPLPLVQKYLNTPSVLQVRLEDRQVNKDIAIFVQYRLAHAQHLSKSTKETIERSIVDRVHPSFLYARLVLNKLLEEHKGDSTEVASVQNALVSLPSSMEDVYSEMLQDHSQLASVPQERQLLILQLVTHSSRPLRLLEIASVLDFLVMNDGASKHGDTKNLTRMSCGPLLEILEDEMVSIIHHSFTEFLMDTRRNNHPAAERSAHPFPIVDSIQTNELMALICVRYLLSGCLSSWEVETTRKSSWFRDPVTSQQKRLQLQHPFLGYALKNWYYHVKRLPILSAELLEQLNSFMNAGNPAFHAWIDAVIKPGYAVESISPLHVAAWAGIANYVKELLATSHNVNAINGDQEMPLTVAAQKGHADVVAILLDCGSLPDEPNLYGQKPLHYAAQSNHHAAVTALLKAGVSPLTPKTCDYPPPRCGNARSGVGDSPLRYASKAGCLESVRAMTPYLDEKDITASFCWAVGSKHIALVKFLLEAVDIDVTGELGGTCLLKAARHLDWDMMQLLIGRGADPNYQPKPVQPVTIDGIPVAMMTRERNMEDASLLHAVCASTCNCYGGCGGDELRTFDKCVNLALSAGCDVNFRGMNGYTALHYCVLNELPIVEKLLQHGADVHATDSSGDTPLHLFKISSKTVPALEILIRHGARLDAIRERDGKTPLHTWCQTFDYKEGIDCLQPYVGNWNVPDADGNTPLHLPAGSSVDLTKQLIDMGADVNWKNHKGETPLHMRNRFSSRSPAVVLLKAGADIEAVDNTGRSWFLRAVANTSSSPEETLQKILDLGANLHATDYEGNGALHLACENHSRKECMGFLIKAGADPRHVNFNGDTIYHVLMRYCFESGHDYFQPALDLTLAMDAPIMATNHRGETLLHSVCKAGVSHYNSSLRRTWQNPINSFPASDVDAMIKTTDNEGKLPIHAAASVSEALVAWCISRGSSSTARTHKSQNPLHLAASAGQSNIVGLLLETYTNTGQTHQVINHQDASGQTPTQ